jgi:AraC-like DNA-binding protein
MCYYINDHLGETSLSPETIAAAHFVSTRHLHNIFLEAGVTVAQWIKQRRLQECRRDLADPLMAAVPVSTIATKWGLEDPGYFSRIFRESFGASPRQWRQDALLGNVA